MTMRDTAASDSRRTQPSQQRPLPHPRPEIPQEAVALTIAWVNRKLSPLGLQAMALVMARPEYRTCMHALHEAARAGNLDATLHAGKALCRTVLRILKPRKNATTPVARGQEE